MIGKMAGAVITAALLGASAVALVPLILLLGAAAGSHAFDQARRPS